MTQVKNNPIDQQKNSRKLEIKEFFHWIRVNLCDTLRITNVSKVRAIASQY